MKSATDFDQELLDLYDEYVHGQTDRRGFLNRAAKFAVGGVTAAALLDSLKPNYALAQQIATDDERISAEYIEYPSPEGHEKNARIPRCASTGRGQSPRRRCHPRKSRIKSLRRRRCPARGNGRLSGSCPRRARTPRRISRHR